MTGKQLGRQIRNFRGGLEIQTWKGVALQWIRLFRECVRPNNPWSNLWGEASGPHDVCEHACLCVCAGDSEDTGEGSGTPLQYSCLENPMDGGTWRAVVHGVAEGRIRLSVFTFTFHFLALEKEMATHSSVLAWRIPGMGEPGGLPSMGSHRVGRDWSDLAAAAATAVVNVTVFQLSITTLNFI